MVRRCPVFVLGVKVVVSHCDDAFDYWGKGTTVTVSSGVQSAPTSPLVVSACSPSSDGFITVGCVTSGFFPPEALKFSWTGGVSDVLQYPAVQQGDTYTAVTRARVKLADWNAEKPFTCKAEHPGSSTPVSSVVKKPIVPVQAPTLLLTAPTQTELDSGSATFICIARHFSPKEHTFKWTLDAKDDILQAQPTIITEEKTNITTYTAVSILEILASEWVDMLSTIKCEVEHDDKTFSKEAKYAHLSDEETEKVEIIPPSTEEMLVQGAGELQCHVKGRKGFKGIQWMRDGQKITSDVQGLTEDSTSLTATAKIDYHDWSNGTEYTCEVEHKLFAEHKKAYKYRRENGGEKKCPSVYALAPPENAQEKIVTLTCYVKNFYPKDVVVYWLANDKILNSTEDDSIDYQHRTSCPIEIEKDLYSVYSQLVIKSEQWETGMVFSCLVYHEAINPTVRTISRSLDNVSGKPTVVSLSMSVPSSPGCIAS
ncbi:hypothetical protein AOLI_G00175830 [Acnodon oligacanthus]